MAEVSLYVECVREWYAGSNKDVFLWERAIYPTRIEKGIGGHSCIEVVPIDRSRAGDAVRLLKDAMGNVLLDRETLQQMEGEEGSDARLLLHPTILPHEPYFYAECLTPPGTAFVGRQTKDRSALYKNLQTAPRTAVAGLLGLEQDAQAILWQKAAAKESKEDETARAKAVRASFQPFDKVMAKRKAR